MAKPIRLKIRGELPKTNKFLSRIFEMHNRHVFEKYGEIGCQALEAATPKKTGKTAASWRYVIEDNGSKVLLYWTNDNRTYQGDMIAVLIQYGHGTGTGGYVRGRDYINPAIRPVFDAIADDLWRIVKQS